MRWLLAFAGLLLCWPAYASTKTTTTIQVECIPEIDVRKALDEGKIERMGMGMNDNDELVILWKIPGARFWISWMKQGDDTACTLAAGPLWLGDAPEIRSE